MGDRDAQVLIGECYELGRGVEQSFEEAVYWYEEAAKQGDKDAQFRVAQYYIEGTNVPQDLDKGLYWYQEASKVNEEK